MIRFALVAALAAVALSGCATKLTPDDGVKLMKSAHDNGCGGTMLLDVRGSTGQLGGSASGQFTLSGKCDPNAGVVSIVPGAVVVPVVPPPPPPAVP